VVARDGFVYSAFLDLRVFPYSTLENLVKNRARLILSFALLCIVTTVLGPQPGRAQAFDPCGPEHAAEGYPNCFSVGAEISKAITAESKMVGQKAAFSEWIAKSRREFWAAYPNGPGLREKRAAFSEALAAKDWYFKVLGVGMAAVDGTVDEQTLRGKDSILGFSTLDNGISPFAFKAFQNWVTNLASSGNLFGPASNRDYDYYVAMRNLAEFRKAGKHITNNPRDYLQLLLELGDGTQGADYRNKGLKAYNERVNLFGEPAVLQAARLVLDTPTNENGGFTKSIAINGFGADTPFQALAASLAGDNPKTMLLASFRAINFDGQTNAQSAYDKMVAQFGEQAVLDAATKASRLRHSNCGDSHKAVCVNYEWHLDDPPTKPNPQHYRGQVDGTMYVATMLLVNPEMHTEKDVMYTKLHITVPNSFDIGFVHIKKTGTGRRGIDDGGLLTDAKDLDVYISAEGSYDLWAEAPRASVKSPVEIIEVPSVPTTINLNVKLDIPPGLTLPNGVTVDSSGVLHAPVATARVPGPVSGLTSAAHEKAAANSRPARNGFLPRGTTLLFSTVDLIDLAGVDANRNFHAELAAPVHAGEITLPVGTPVKLKVTRMEERNPIPSRTIIVLRVASVETGDTSRAIQTNGATRYLNMKTVNATRGGDAPVRKFDEVAPRTRFRVTVE
jgi:hypothetical protein